MSGVEVAGFVLAVFPLAITALEHYRESADVLGIWWKFRKEYRAWNHSLSLCRLSFESNLEEFLLPLIADEEQLQSLLAKPDGPEWKNPDLERRLRERLPKSYELYVESIDRIKDLMNELKHELGIDKAGFHGKVSQEGSPRLESAKPTVDAFASKANLEYQIKRFKMSFNQSKRDKLFKDLTDCNNELRMLLDTSDRIAALRQSRSAKTKPAANKELWKFWHHADRLYNLLIRSWKCDCKRFHLAHLLLQHRTTQKADFRIMFVYGQQNFTPKPWSWTCQETNIKMLEDKPQLQENSSAIFTQTPNTSVPAPALAMATSPVTLPKKPSFGRSMLKRFKKDGCDDLSNLCNTPATQESETQPLIPTPSAPVPQITLTNTSAPISHSEEIDMTDISDLCNTIATYHSDEIKHRSCFKDEQGRFALNPIKSQVKADAQNTVTLENLLRKDTETAFVLTRRQRYFIVLTLASSHLQLYSTPWISRRWSKRDILFLRDSTNPSRIILDQPYISRDFVSTITPESENPNDRSLSNLGIMLLELCFGTALEDHESRQKYAVGLAPNPFLDMAAALEWSPRVVEEAGPEFYDAILWCLHNMPGSGEVDGKLEKWREELFLKVVQPLMYCYDQFIAAGK